MRAELIFKRGILAIGCGVASALGFALFSGTAAGQQMTGVEAMDFKIELENYTPPFEAQPKTLLESAKVQPQPGGIILLTEAKLKTFSTNGTLELLAQSPHCTFDSNRRIASSPGPLQLQTGDGRFFTEGQGFLWDQTNSSLVISNRVHTITRKDMLAPPASPSLRPTRQAAEPADDIEVFSDWFEYNQNSGWATYHGHVRVTGTNLQLTADSLYLELPVPGASLKTIKAEGDVVIDRGGLHATGDKAAYSASSDVVTLTGHPAWRMGRREGRGDELVLDRTNSVFRANGHAYLKFPRDSAETSLLLDLSPVPINSLDSTNRIVEVFSDSYELRTNLAVFRHDVQGSESVENRPQGKLNCDVMTILFSGSNQVQRIVAQDKVLVEQNGGRISAERAVFSTTNSVAEFSGKPSWQLGPREGSGDLLILDSAGHEMKALGNARMKLPADQIRIVEMNPAAALSDTGTTGTTGTNARSVEITCNDYDLKKDLNFFRGNVRVRNPKGRLLCDLLTVKFSQHSGEESKNAVAERQQNRVELVWVDAKGQPNYSSSDKAIYSYTVTNSVTNELVTLSGKPLITNPQGTHTGDPIIWDRIHNTVWAAHEKSQVTQTGTNPPDGFLDPDRPRTNAAPLPKN